MIWKRFNNIIFLICLTAIMLLGYSVFKKINIINEKKILGERLPDFDFFLMNGQVFKRNEIPNDKKTVVIYFNTECEYCDHEAEEIGKKIDQFQGANILFVSPNMVTDINIFSARHGLEHHSNILLLQDKNKIFSERFGGSVFPSIYMYGANQKLIKKFHKQMPVDSLLKYLNN